MSEQPFSQKRMERAAALLDTLRALKLQVVTAESCTGGLIAGLLTEIPGSSDVVERGFVTYSNAGKSEMIGVSADLIAKHGAVSKPVAIAMAEGALAHSKADISVAVTGVAGPGGGTAEKPVGLVHFATARRNGETFHSEQHFGELSRRAIRLAAVDFAFSLLERQAGTVTAPR